jgi:hypothetical protein
VFCLAGVLQVGTSPGNAIELQQVAIVTVTVYVPQPVYVTVAVPVYVPVTVPTTVFRTHTTVQNKTFTNFLTFVVVEAPNTFLNPNATWTKTYTYTNGTQIRYSTTYLSSYTDTNRTGSPTHTFTVTMGETSYSSYTTTSTYTHTPFFQIQTLMTYVTAAPQWWPQPNWAYQLASVGAVGAIAGYLLRGSLVRRQRSPKVSDKRCLNCGAPLAPGETFCTSCGQRS